MIFAMDKDRLIYIFDSVQTAEIDLEIINNDSKDEKALQGIRTKLGI